MANKKIKFVLEAVNKTKAQFDKVTRQLNTLKNAGAGVAKAMIGVTVAIAATAVAFGAVVKKSFEFIDAIGKTATRTGLATSTIQAFSLAALESGTTIEGGNKALEKFARSVGDAQRGLKTTRDIFKALNVELVDQNGNYKTTDQLLEETAKGISGLNSQTEKATALANLFGRQGILLTNALEDLGKSGLKGFTDRAEELGLVLSDKSIRAVEVFNDKVSVIGLQLQTIKAQIMVGFLPVFEELRQTIANKISAIKNDFGGFDKLAVDVVREILSDRGARANIIKKYLPIMNQLINKYLQDMDFFISFILDEEFNETVKSRNRDKFIYNSFSEGEKMRIDLALLFTWRSIAKLKNSTNTNLLILDEIFDSSLDGQGTEDFFKIVRTMPKENIFIISHKGDILFDKFTNIVKFQKEHNFTQLEAV